MTARSLETQKVRLLSSRAALLTGLAVGGVLLVTLLVSSITVGAAEIATDTVFAALFTYDDSLFEHLVIRTVRLPRVVAGAVVGAGLAVAGGIMQGLTRNPLASPSILGINAGAAFGVVMAVYILGSPPLTTYALFAMLGATGAAAIVYGLGSMGRRGATPLRLTLAGVILTTFLASFTTAILVLDQETLDQIRFWTAGSLGGRDWELFVRTAPYVGVGLLSAFAIARQITTISLGEDIAVTLGQKTTQTKVLAALSVVLLAGGAVALAGPIGFVGLIIPHVARFFVGVDYRWILPYSALMGAGLVTVADMAARIIIRPQEFPVGVMLAILGAPFFIYLARSKVNA